MKIPDFKSILSYCALHSTPMDQVLVDLERETFLKTLTPQMISGPLQGKFLALLSKIIQPERILEIGTFTGYSAICLASGLSQDGILHTIEADEEILYLAKKYFRKTGLENKIKLHLGSAEEVIPKLNEKFDLVFIDANKLQYALYYDLVFEKVKKGGIILADNTLWGGKVLYNAIDPDTQALMKFNEKIHSDPRVENVMIPMRDGLLMARKM